tara:strand:- start:19696 stop:20382 length:687 start_codon:yes stop_codon:yes gene_type:complete
MDIIPVIDIMNNNVVTAYKGNRSSYKTINSNLYNSTDPKIIINEIVKKYSPNIIYIADLDAINKNSVNHSLYKYILNKFPKIIFWVDSGLKKINLNKNYKNYYPIYCSEKSKGFELISDKFKRHICSYDYKKKLLGSKSIHRFIKSFPKKIIIMDLYKVGTLSKPNFYLAKRIIRKRYNNEYYIAGGMKSLLDIKNAKKIGAKGVLVSSMIHVNKLNKFTFKKERVSH